MLLAADIGNTSIVLGFFENDELKFSVHINTEKQKSSDEYAVKLNSILEMRKIAPSDIDGAIISSVVPELTSVFSSAVDEICGVKPMTVGEKHHGKLKCDVVPFKQLGADLICGCVGAMEKYPLPAIIADMGTATKLLVIDEEGFFLGCIIAPGVRISLRALTERASLLPEIDLAKPESIIGTDTIESMQAGSIYGSAAMIDGLIERIIEETKLKNPSLIGTGGYMKHILPCCKKELIYDENLLLDGLKAIFDIATGG